MSFVGNASSTDTFTTLGSGAVNAPLPSKKPYSGAGKAKQGCKPPEGVQTVVRSTKRAPGDYAVIRVGTPQLCTRAHHISVGQDPAPPCGDFLFYGLVDNGTKKRHKIYLPGGTFLTCDIPLDQKCPTLKDWSNPAVCTSRALSYGV
jgi:hypothetical protein